MGRRLHRLRQGDAGGGIDADRRLAAWPRAKVKLVNAIASGQQVRWDDVEIDESQSAVAFRRSMERATAMLEDEAIVSGT